MPDLLLAMPLQGACMGGRAARAAQALTPWRVLSTRHANGNEQQPTSSYNNGASVDWLANYFSFMRLPAARPARPAHRPSRPSIDNYEATPIAVLINFVIIPLRAPQNNNTAATRSRRKSEHTRIMQRTTDWARDKEGAKEREGEKASEREALEIFGNKHMVSMDDGICEICHVAWWK